MQLINRVTGVVFLCLFFVYATQAATPTLVIYTYDSFTSEWGARSPGKESI